MYDDGQPRTFKQPLLGAPKRSSQSYMQPRAAPAVLKRSSSSMVGARELSTGYFYGAASKLSSAARAGVAARANLGLRRAPSLAIESTVQPTGPSWIEASMTIANTLIGAGVLGLPYALNSYIAAAKHPGAAWPASVHGRYVLLNGAMQLVTLGCLALPLVLRRTNLELRKGSLAGAVGVMVAAAPMNGASFGPQAR